MISSRRFREKMSASDRHDGRSSGRRAGKPDSPAARRGNAPYASRQIQHPFSAGSRGRSHQPFTPSSSPAPPPARRGRCAPPLSLHRANPGRAAWERRVRGRGGHGSCNPASMRVRDSSGRGSRDAGSAERGRKHGCVLCMGHECAGRPRLLVEAGRCTRFNGAFHYDCPVNVGQS